MLRECFRTERRGLGGPLLAPLLLLTQLPLIPQPREFASRPDVALTRGVTIAASQADDRFATQDLSDALRERGVRIAPAGTPGAVRVTLARLGTPAAQRALAAARAVWYSTACRR